LFDGFAETFSLMKFFFFGKLAESQEMLKQFGQLIFLVSQNTTGIGPVEKAAIQQLDDLTTNGIEKVMKGHRLDAIVAPDSSSATVLAIAGLPGIVVPAGYDEQGVPFGITFGGLKGYEPRLIEIAYAFEQATKVRSPPMFKQ
jgi:amidase